MLFTNTKTLRKHIVSSICPKLHKPKPVVTSSAIDSVDQCHIEECQSNEILPKVIAEVTNDYKLSFIKSLQMSGSISLVKSAEILASANSLVNSIVEISKTFINSDLTNDQIVLKLNALKDPFHSSNSSQYKIEKLLKQENLYVEATEKSLGSHFKFDRIRGAMKEKFDNLYYFELFKILPTILMKYKNVLNSVHEGSDPIMISNFKSAKFFKTLKGNPLCLQIYYDDIEVCNPLGAKAKIHKLGMFYFIISNFPPHLKSQLATIFPLLVVKSKYIKEYGMNSILKPIVEELNKLSFDFQPQFLTETPFTHVSLFQICGDNLGLHSILGFTEGFNANFRCRFCKASKEETFRDVEEKILLRRTQTNYNIDLGIANFSLTGIRDLSIVNNLNEFHVTDNFAPDIMHDIFEGICIIELRLILKHVLQSSQLTLQPSTEPQNFYFHTKI
jgi:hypothetical protein